MDKKIETIYKTDGNWDFITELAENSSIGFDVKKKRAGRNETGQKVYHATDKKLTYKIREGTAKCCEMLLAPIAETLLHNSNKFVKKILWTNKNKPAIVTKDGRAFCEELKLCKSEDLTEDYFCLYNKKSLEDLEKEYYQRQKDYREIGERFGINAEEFIYSDTLTARALLYHHIKHIQGMQHVTYDEYSWIDGSSQGGLMTATEGVFENVRKYDINSMYGYLMQRSGFQFPLTEGTIQTVSKIDKRKVGIWKLNILSNHRLFRRTKDNKYTTYHIWLLDTLKIRYELIKCDNNAIIYTDAIDGDDIFYYLRDLFELKRNGNMHAKDVINCTWGEATREKTFDVPCEDVGLDRKHLIVGYNHERNTFKLQGGQHPYKHVTARLKPFLLSYVRYFFVGSILRYIPEDKLLQINTDGFFSTMTPEEIADIWQISKELGHLKIEKEYKKAHIVNCHKIIPI